LEMVAQADCPSRSHYLFRAKDGIPIGYFGNAFFRLPNGDCDTTAYQLPRRGNGQRGNLRVPRKLLRRFLYDKLVEEKTRLQKLNPNQEDLPAVQWNHTLVEFQWVASTQKYNLKFETPTGCGAKEPSLSRPISFSADLLIAADGIRSTVLQQMYIARNSRKQSLPWRKSLPPPSIYDSPEYYGLRFLGVRLILGIADFDSTSVFMDPHHPLQLLNERGFYTLDGQGRRLFTMPYQSNRFVRDPQGTKNRVMWQLSFATTLTRQQQDAESLKKMVLDTCQAWHQPVMDLIQATPVESIWETDLMDRDPQQVYHELVCGNDHRQPEYPRLVVVGDALHSMSPFKGQGANQALADGPLLAKWLQKSSLDAALTGWWRETLNRTVPIVQASQTAAQELHSASVGDDVYGNSTCNIKYLHGFAGVRPIAIPRLLDLLEREGIGAHLGRAVDQEIYQRIEANGWFHVKEKDLLQEKSQDRFQHSQREALHYASCGDTEKLRQMSLDHNKLTSIFCARDDQGRSCLHLAILHDHFVTAKWLLVELQCCKHAKDIHGKTAFEYCSDHSKIAHIFDVVATGEYRQ
jgi:2-polyprenyl-6-methoxyphenol hydroxylase-like FAD-dependent oxidoreductase